MWRMLGMSQTCTRFSHTAFAFPLPLCAILLSAHSALLHTVSRIGFTTLVSLIRIVNDLAEESCQKLKLGIVTEGVTRYKQ
jgi:hypothetical protein